MKRLLCMPAALLLASLAIGQGHNGTRSWGLDRWLATVGGPSEAFLAFRSDQGVDLVAARSVMLVGSEAVVSTRHAIETKIIGGPVALSLVTHGDESMHQRCLEDLLDGPIPTAMATAVKELVTYYVDKNWLVHKVVTGREREETPLNHARRHKKALEEFMSIFPCDKEKTQQFALAKAGNAAAISGGK